MTKKTDKNQLDSKNNNDTFALWNENTKEREKTRKTVLNSYHRYMANNTLTCKLTEILKKKKQQQHCRKISNTSKWTAHTQKEKGNINDSKTWKDAQPHSLSKKSKNVLWLWNLKAAKI